nr:hypothetical protein BaRGS_030977 [Batillaria attramentaria]
MSSPAARKNRAWRVVLDAGFLRVCPIQPHFLRRICLATGSCPARSHSSSFRIFSGHRMLKMRLRQPGQCSLVPARGTGVEPQMLVPAAGRWDWKRAARDSWCLARA